MFYCCLRKNRLKDWNKFHAVQTSVAELPLGSTVQADSDVKQLQHARCVVEKHIVSKLANSAIKCCSCRCAVEKHVWSEHAIPRRCLATCLVATSGSTLWISFEKDLPQRKHRDCNESGVCTIQSSDWLLQSKIRSTHPKAFILPTKISSARGIFMNWRL